MSRKGALSAVLVDFKSTPGPIWKPGWNSRRGGESRHVLEEVEIANCGWTGTMSGARSGAVKGGIVIPTDHLASIDLEELMSLTGPDALGPLGDGAAGLPTASQLEILPFGLFMGSRQPTRPLS